MFQSDLFPAGEQMPAVPLAFAIGARIAALLTSGRHLTRAGISGLFAEETGVLDWGGARRGTFAAKHRSSSSSSRPRRCWPG